MTRCRLVAGSNTNLPQKNSVLNDSVAGVAGVAGFFRSSCKEEKNREAAQETQPNKSGSPATPATPATALPWSAEIRCRFAHVPATNLQQGVTACP